MADNHQNSPMAEMNWDEMEGLFCQQMTQGSPKLGRDLGTDTVDRRSRKDNEVSWKSVRVDLSFLIGRMFVRRLRCWMVNEA